MLDKKIKRHCLQGVSEFLNIAFELTYQLSIFILFVLNAAIKSRQNKFLQVSFSAAFFSSTLEAKATQGLEVQMHSSHVFSLHGEKTNPFSTLHYILPL